MTGLIKLVHTVSLTFVSIYGTCWLILTTLLFCGVKYPGRKTDKLLESLMETIVILMVFGLIAAPVIAVLLFIASTRG